MKKYIILFAAALLGVSCSNLLDQDPTGNITPDDLKKVDPDIVVKPLIASAVSSVHSTGATVEWKGYKDCNLYLDMLGNDMLLVLGAGGGWYNNAYNMNNYRGATDSNAAYQWAVYYTYIYAANQALGFIDLEQSKNVEKAKYYLAQAYTIRAFAYYHLITLYQDAYLHGGKDKSGVPVYTVAGEPAKGRGTAQAVYGQIITDCTDAIKYFTESGQTPSTKEEVSIYVAYMTLARTALTMGDYEAAASAAGKVIDGFALMSETQALDNGFQKLDSPETIWGYKFSSSTSNRNNSFSSHMSAYALGYGGSNGGYKMIDERLYNQIPSSDWRKKLYFATDTQITYDNGTSTTVGTAPALTNVKFGSATYEQDEVYMRVAEAYFIKAEALASQATPDYPGAQQVLYDIVSTRDAAYTKSSATGQALLDEIRLQKRIEMWGEGLEFYDNKRINKGVDRQSSTNHPSKKVVPAGKDFTLRLPQTTEIERNPNISDEDNNPL